MNARTDVATQSNASTLLTAIASASSNPQADIDKMERLFAMHQQMVKAEAEASFNAALARAQKRILPVANNATNDQTRSRYAKLSQINKEIIPIYTDEGFAISFNTADCPTPGWQRTLATLSHEHGHSREYHLDMPPDMAGIAGKVNKTPIHATASSNSYARRYLVCMIFNVTTEDDTDGNPQSRVTPNAGAGETLTLEDREKLTELGDKVKVWITAGSMADAVQELENADLDVDSKLFVWSLFDSKARSAIKREQARLKEAQAQPESPVEAAASETISDAARKRLEARITELKLDRDEVKAYVKAFCRKDHFADLTKAEYSTLDLWLDEQNQKRPERNAAGPSRDGQNAPLSDPIYSGQRIVSPQDRPAVSPSPEQSEADTAPDGETTHITDEEVLALDARCTENGIDVVKLRKKAGVERLALIKPADLPACHTWITKVLANRKNKEAA